MQNRILVQNAKNAILNKSFDVLLALDQAKLGLNPLLPIPEFAIAKESLKTADEYCVFKSGNNEFYVYTLQNDPKRIRKYRLEVDFAGKFVLRDTISNWIGWANAERTSISDIGAAIKKCLTKHQGAAEYQLISAEKINKSIAIVVGKSHEMATQKQKNKRRDDVKFHLVMIKRGVLISQVKDNVEAHLTDSETKLGLTVYEGLRVKYRNRFLQTAGNSTKAKVDMILFEFECYLAKMISPAVDPVQTLQNKNARKGYNIYQVALRALLDPEANNASFRSLFHRGSEASYQIEDVSYHFRDILAYYWLAASDPSQPFPKVTPGTSVEYYLQESILNFIAVLAEARMTYGYDRPSCSDGAFGRLFKNGLMYRQLGQYEKIFIEIDNIVNLVHDFILATLPTVPAIAEIFCRKAYLLESNEEIFAAASGDRLRSLNQKFIRKMQKNQLDDLIDFIYQHAPCLKAYHDKHSIAGSLLRDNFSIGILTIYEAELEKLNCESVYFEPHASFLEKLAKEGVAVKLTKLIARSLRELYSIREQLIDLQSRLKKSPDPQSQQHQDQLAVLADQLLNLKRNYWETIENFIEEMKLNWGMQGFLLDKKNESADFNQLYSEITPLVREVHQSFKLKKTTGIQNFSSQFYLQLAKFCHGLSINPNVLFSLIIGIEDGLMKDIVKLPDGSYHHTQPVCGETILSSHMLFKPAPGKKQWVTLPRMFAWIYTLLKKDLIPDFQHIIGVYHRFCYDYIDRYFTKLPPESIDWHAKRDIEYLQKETGYNVCGEESYFVEDFTPLREFVQLLLQKLLQPVDNYFCYDHSLKLIAANILHVFLKLDGFRPSEERILLPHLCIEPVLSTLVAQKQYPLAYKVFDGVPLNSLDQASKDRILAHAEQLNHKEFAEWLIKHGAEMQHKIRLAC